MPCSREKTLLFPDTRKCSKSKQDHDNTSQSCNPFHFNQQLPIPFTPQRSREVGGGLSAWRQRRVWQRCRLLRCFGLLSVPRRKISCRTPWRIGSVNGLLGVTYATVRLQDLQSQIPTEWRLTLVFPQKVQTYLACWVISIFFTDFRREAPYLYKIKSAPVPSTVRRPSF